MNHKIIKLFTPLLAFVMALSGGMLTCYAQDITGPTFESITTSNGNEWTFRPVTITVNGAYDNETGLADEAYSFSTEQYDYHWQAENYTTVYRSWSVWVYIRDKTGDITCAGYVPVFIDRTWPVIEDVQVVNHNDGSYTLTIVAHDWGAGLGSYSFDDGKTWQKTNTKRIYTDATEITVAVSDQMTHITYYTCILVASG